MDKIYQVQIVLKGAKPKIWRRILVFPTLLLSDFHKIIQVTMGWTNSHLHQFKKNGKFFTARHKNDDLWDEMDNIDYRFMILSDFLKKEKEKIVYEYDFGDAWEHDIILEKILPVEDNVSYPVCIAGKMCCPPEDCGGIWGFANMLDILKQPKHEEYDSYIEWLGGNFDPKYFDISKINEILLNKEYLQLEI
jgi:hypothetical protein